jgi:uncharacterized protein (TIGR02145 family)
MISNWNGVYAGSVSVNNDSANDLTYGRLYNYAMVTAPDFAPSGWHVPTKAELDTLLTFTGGLIGPLKEIGTTYWNAPNAIGTNTLGYNLKGAGITAYADGWGYVPVNFKDSSAIWTSSHFGITGVYLFVVTNITDVMSEVNSIIDDGVGIYPDVYYSVRFIKD